MAAFRFKLEPYKRLVHHDKEMAQIEFSLKMARVKEVRDVLEQLKKEFYVATRELETRLEEGIDTGEYRIWAERLDHLRQEESHLEQILRQREIEAEEAKHKLLETYVQERLVERLRERALNDYQREEARRIQNELDDMCNSRPVSKWVKGHEGRD